AMAKKTKRGRAPKKRSLFRELMSGVQAMRDHREGRLTLRTHQVEPITVPSVDPDFVRETREALHMSRRVFAFKIGVNPRTLELAVDVAVIRRSHYEVFLDDSRYLIFVVFNSYDPCGSNQPHHAGDSVLTGKASSVHEARLDRRCATPPH